MKPIYMPSRYWYFWVSKWQIHHNKDWNRYANLRYADLEGSKWQIHHNKDWNSLMDESISFVNCGQNDKSIITRIETFFGVNHAFCFFCQNDKSIITRIETCKQGWIHFRWSHSQNDKSIITRIETTVSVAVAN